MTSDRDIRFTREQIRVTQYALRDEVKRRTRSITQAEAAAAAGRTIQRGTLDAHYRDLIAARAILDNLDAAARQLDRRDDDERRTEEGDEQRDYAEERFNEQLQREA